jgi:subtilisin family serine protease
MGEIKDSLLFWKTCIITIILLTVFALCKDSRAEYVPGEILVKFKDSSDIASINSLHSNIGSVRKKRFKSVRVHHIKLPDGMSVEEAIEYYSQDPNVEYAEPNYIVHITTTPDDPNFSNLWGLHNTGQTGGTSDADIDAPEAWDITTGSSEVVIAVIDTGVVYNHPDLSDNIWTNTGETDCGDGVDNDNNGYVDDCYGWDFIGDDNDPTDYNGHGTHVAGTIAAVGNNSTGITGVMWQVKIMPVRFMGINGSGNIADAISALLYANENGAHVINISWGGTEYSQALKDAIDASNAVVVCAAGNDGVDNDTTPHYPSSYDSANIIAVGATDHNDCLASFSNYGVTSVDVVAPGVSIYSSIPEIGYGSSVTVYGTEDFDSTSGDLPLLGWEKGGTNATWAITTGTGVSSTHSLEDSPTGNYVNNTSSWVGYMTSINSEKDNIYTLSFKWRGQLEPYFDYLDINYSTDGSNWYWIDYRTESSETLFITDSTTAFTEIAEMYDSFYFGFGLTTDESGTYDGVYIDDVTLTRTPLNISGYSYTDLSGTSMAAPHVSGIAGLIKALNPALSNLEIKNAILNSVDGKSSLISKVLTGGRVNAYKALLVAQGESIGLSTVENDSCGEPDPPNISPDRFNGDGGSGGGKCFIATAAYGSIMHPYVIALREFRDRHLLTNSLGRILVDLYYTYSPPVADIIKDNEHLRLITRILLAPAIMFVVFPYTSIGIFTIFLILAAIILKRLKKTR